MSPKDDIREWLDDKNVVLGLLSLAVVGAAEDFAWMLRKFRARHDLAERLPPLPPTDEWMAMYRDHNGVWNGAFALVGLGEFGGITITDLARSWRQLGRRAKSNPEELGREITKELQTEGGKAALDLAQQFMGVIAMGKEWLIEMAVGGTPFDEDDDERFERLIHDPNVQFFLRVCGPCWLEYGVFPGELMKDARHGKIEALDRLLRLDKLARSEPRVSDHIDEAAYSSTPGRYKRICRAIESAPRNQTKDTCRKWVKIGMAAFISLVSEQMEEPLDQGDIRELFDLVSRARTGHVDPDLPDTPEALEKSIRRNRNARKLGAARTKEK